MVLTTAKFKVCGIKFHDRNVQILGKRCGDKETPEELSSQINATVS